MKQYHIHALDFTDANALERRISARQAHLDGAKLLKETNNFIVGGAILSEEGKMIGSNLILQFETKIELDKWLNYEPYITNKVWDKIEITLFKMADV